MDSNQSEPPYFLSKLASNIISPAQYPCTVMGSNKNNIHTIVPNISNSSLNINAKYQNSNDSKIAQNIAYNCYSNIANSSYNIANQNEDLKLLFSSTKPKKLHNKRLKNVTQCVNKDNDNSSDITAAPNQLTILMQEVLPAQVPDHHPLSSAHQSHISAQSLSSVISSPHNAAVLSPVAVLPSSVVDTISTVINDVLVKAMSNDPHDDVFLSVLKSRCDPSSPENNRHIPTTFIQPHTTSPQFMAFVENNIPDDVAPTNKRRNTNATKSVSKRPKLSEPLYNDHKPYQRCQLSAPNFRRLVHEPRISEKCVVLPPLGVTNRGLPCVDLGQLEDNCIKYKRTPFSLARPYPRNVCQDRFIVQNLNANIPSGALLASRDIPDDLDCIVAPSPNNNDLDYLSVFTSDQVSSPSVNLPGPNLEMLHPPIRLQSPQLSLFHCPNRDYLTRDSSSLIRSRKCASTPTSDTSIVDSETGEMVCKTKNRNEKVQMSYNNNATEDLDTRYKVTSSGEEMIIDKDILQSKSADFFLSLDKSELPLYSEKVYKSTSLLWTKKSRDKPSLEDDDGESLADIAVESIATDNAADSGQFKDRRIFIGEIPSDTTIVVQGSVSKSKQICKRLHIVLNDKISKRKAIMKCNARQFKGTKYHSHRNTPPPFTETFVDHSVISESQFVTLSREMGTIHRRCDVIDSRRCLVCEREGDCEEDGVGRLLCQGLNRWVHVSCGIWWPGVFETLGGALHDVPSDNGGNSRHCIGCNVRGASVACSQAHCHSKYHVDCARDHGCVLQSSNDHVAMFCASHDISGGSTLSLRVPRRVYVVRDECSEIEAAINDNGDTRHCLRIGTLVLLSIGQLLPHQIQCGHYHTMNHVYPVGYRSRRLHWSCRVPNKRCWYECEIVASADDRPRFRITELIDEGPGELQEGPGVVCEGKECTETWRQMLNKIDELRGSQGLVRVWPGLMRGEDLYGLTEPWIVRAIESLPGLEAVHDYAFKYGKMELLKDMPLPVCATGSVRTEIYVPRSLSRHVYRSLSSYTTVSGGGLSGSNQVSLAVGTCTSKWQQYRRLKHDWKHNVVLKRSKIQGLGLYAAKDLEKGTMIIEYVGELIRNEVANRRETMYESRQQGVYMFRLDDSTVIDATRAGDMARYINHSCEPNCVTEVVTDFDSRRINDRDRDRDRDKHIVIIANRRIEKNEELNYDYKFDLDDASDEKIPCLCGAKNCRRWMN